MSRVMFMASGTAGNWGGPDSNMLEIGSLIGAIFLIVLLVFIWAAFWRKPREHKLHHHHHHGAAPVNGRGASLPERRPRRPALLRLLRPNRHRKRLHSRERPANPTLAQVGGLPPSRRPQPPVH